MRKDRFRAGLDKLVPATERASDAPRSVGQALATALDLQDGVNRLPEAREIPLDQIHPNPNQPRQTFDAEALEGLAASIREQGVLQPITVSPDGDTYRIVAGERRWRAAKLAGLSRIPALVRTLTDQEQRIVALMENLQREDLNDMDRARGLADLRDLLTAQNPGASSHELDEEVGRRLGISGRSVRNFLSLLHLSPPVQESIATGDLTEKHGRALRRFSDPGVQQQVTQAVAQHKLTGDETVALVSAMKKQPEEPVENLAVQVKARAAAPSHGTAPTRPARPGKKGLQDPAAPVKRAVERLAEEIAQAEAQITGPLPPGEVGSLLRRLENLAQRVIRLALIIGGKPPD
jgi:ParB family chromosome partitioning protein